MSSLHVVVCGGSGVIGAGALEHFSQAGWTVTALSRRQPVVRADCIFSHISVDLNDRGACAAVLATLPSVTHLVYAAVAEVPGLVSGWYDPALMQANERMLANVLDPLAAAGSLRHVSLLQGAKAYGGHHHATQVPGREDSPRDDHPNFYWLQEDLTRARAQAAGFDFTIFRPQVLLGGVAGAAMNPVAAIGAYAALTRELGRPFAFPGRAVVWELVDTRLMAKALAWAATEPAAANQIFNITNGDVLVLEHAWPRLAQALGLAGEGETPESFTAFFADPGTQAAWAQLAKRHDLRVPTLAALLGESHHYLDMLLSPRIADKPIPMLLSTIKIRQAGFGACHDSLDSLFYWLRQMAALNLLPPFGGRLTLPPGHITAAALPTRQIMA